MNCKMCRWYEETFVQHTINGKIYKGICLLRGCDGSQYEPKDGAKMDEVWRMISKIMAVSIVHNVIAEHLHGEWNEEEQAQVFSAWDWELLEINKEICNKIRDEVTE